MAQSLAKGGRRGAVYDDIILQSFPACQQTAHATDGSAAVEDEPHHEETDPNPAADRSTTAIRKLSERDRLYSRIQEALYNSAVKQLEEDSLTAEEECADYCCYSAICMAKINHKTPVLRRAREMGWKLFALIVIPLMGKKSRQLFVYSELIAIITALVISAITFDMGRDAAFDVVFLVIAIIGSLLAVADTLFCLYTSFCVCKDCCENNRPRAARGRDQGSENTATEVASASDEEAAKTSTEQCGTCERTNKAVNVVDVVRIIATELLFYPLLVCSIFKVVVTEAYKFETSLDTLSFVLFLICALSFVIFVYLVRIMIIIRAICRTQKIRRPPPQHTTASTSQFDYSISWSARRLHWYLTYHTVMQMLLQILMLLATAARFRHDREQILGSVDIAYILVNSPLWFTLVGGYAIPICGSLTFFIVTFPWVQEFPVGLCIDMIAALQLSEGTLVAGEQASAANFQEKREKITAYFRVDELKKKFRVIHNPSRQCTYKLFYPFFSPTMVALCILFAAMHTAYALAMTRDDLLFPASGMIIFACFSTIANMFTFSVAVIWITTITAALLVLIMLLVGIVILGFVTCGIFVVVVALGVYFGCIRTCK